MMVGFQQPNKCECLSFFFFLIIIIFFFMIDDISICKFNIVKFVIFLVSLNFTIKMLQTDIVLATNKSIQTFI